MKLEKNERMSSSLLDGIEYDNFRYQGGEAFTPMKKTGFPFSSKEVAEIMSSLWKEKEE